MYAATWRSVRLCSDKPLPRRLRVPVATCTGYRAAFAPGTPGRLHCPTQAAANRRSQPFWYAPAMDLGTVAVGVKYPFAGHDAASFQRVAGGGCQLRSFIRKLLIGPCCTPDGRRWRATMVHSAIPMARASRAAERNARHPWWLLPIMLFPALFHPLASC